MAADGLPRRAGALESVSEWRRLKLALSTVRVLLDLASGVIGPPWLCGRIGSSNGESIRPLRDRILELWTERGRGDCVDSFGDRSDAASFGGSISDTLRCSMATGCSVSSERPLVAAFRAVNGDRGDRGVSGDRNCAVIL